MPDKRYEGIVSDEAKDMLLEHVRFLALANVGAANGLADEFASLVNSLETMPERFPQFIHNGHILTGYRKALFAQRYVAVFCMEKDIVYLDFVVDCRRNNDALLEALIN